MVKLKDVLPLLNFKYYDIYEVSTDTVNRDPLVTNHKELLELGASYQNASEDNLKYFLENEVVQMYPTNVMDTAILAIIIKEDIRGLNDNFVGKPVKELVDMLLNIKNSYYDSWDFDIFNNSKWHELAYKYIDHGYDETLSLESCKPEMIENFMNTHTVLHIDEDSYHNATLYITVE